MMRSPSAARIQLTIQALCYVASLSFLTPAFAEPTPVGHVTEQITPNGSMNWTTGVATATGLGVPPRNAVSPMQSKEMTRTAAWSVALANLLEVVKGIRVDAHTTVQNHVTTSTDIQTQVEGFVHGAKVVSEQELPTGEIKTTVQMRVAGPLSDKIVKIEKEISAPVMPPSSPPEVSNKKKPYTGLVIDARGTGAQAALAPRILSESGVTIYGPDYPSKTIVSGPTAEEPGRVAWYFSDEAQAMKHAKVNANPLVIKALRSAGASQTDLVIEDQMARRVQIPPEHFRFLKEARVLIVLDPK